MIKRVPRAAAQGARHNPCAPIPDRRTSSGDRNVSEEDAADRQRELVEDALYQFRFPCESGQRDRWRNRRPLCGWIAQRSGQAGPASDSRSADDQLAKLRAGSIIRAPVRVIRRHPQTPATPPRDGGKLCDPHNAATKMTSELVRLYGEIWRRCAHRFRTAPRAALRPHGSFQQAPCNT